MKTKTNIWKAAAMLLVLLMTNPLPGQNSVIRKTGKQAVQTEEERLMALAKAFVAIFNAPDLEKANSYAHMVYLPEKAKGLAALLRQDGPIEPGKIRIMPGNRSIHVIARVQKTGKWQNFQIGLTETAPRMGIRLFIASASAPFIIPPGEVPRTPSHTLPHSSLWNSQVCPPPAVGLLDPPLM